MRTILRHLDGLVAWLAIWRGIVYRGSIGCEICHRRQHSGLWLANHRKLPLDSHLWEACKPWQPVRNGLGWLCPDCVPLADPDPQMTQIAQMAEQIAERGPNGHEGPA